MRRSIWRREEGLEEKTGEKRRLKRIWRGEEGLRRKNSEKKKA